MKRPCPYHQATPQPNVLRSFPLYMPSQWRETPHPGDAAINLDVMRGEEIGMIRVQVYGPANFMVASYTPGYETSYPGDSPKFNPDRCEWCETKIMATVIFTRYVIAAFRDGWRPVK